VAVLKIIKILFPLAALFGLMFWLFSCAAKENISYGIVTDRHWEFGRSIRYDSYDCGMKMDFDGDWTYQCDWERHTRCRMVSRGERLPPVAPEITCKLHRGDDIVDSVEYFIQYRLEEGTDRKSKRVSRGAWMTAELGKHIEIVTNGFGSVQRVGVVN